MAGDAYTSPMKVEHARFGPHVIELAHFLVNAQGGNAIDVFDEVHRRYPNLSFADFRGAAILGQALAMKPRGHA
jgi:hypothetical protein